MTWLSQTVDITYRCTYCLIFALLTWSKNVEKKCSEFRSGVEVMFRLERGKRERGHNLDSSTMDYRLKSLLLTLLPLLLSLLSTLPSTSFILTKATLKKNGYVYRRETLTKVWVKKGSRGKNGKGFAKSSNENRPPLEATNEGGLEIKEMKSEIAEERKSAGEEVTSIKYQKENDKEMAMEQVFRKYGMMSNEDKKRSDGGGYSETKVKDILNKAGTKKTKRERDPDSPFGESIIAGIPLAAQAKIDNILVTATFGALAFVVLSGVAISLGALTVVFPTLIIPETIDDIAKNILSPAFTPSLGVFFFFSITFGIFKFAQISSSGTVYREDS